MIMYQLNQTSSMQKNAGVKDVIGKIMPELSKRSPVPKA